MNNRIEFASALRGLAAVLVVIAHYFSVFWLMRPVAAWQSHALVELPSSIATPWLAHIVNGVPPLNAGALGVSIFFLISGFVIPFSFEKQSGLGFALGRVFRIYPTYAAGLTITLVAMYLNGLHFTWPWSYSAETIAAHFFPGFRDVVGTPMLDGISWTLNVEIKFYVLCAAMALAFRRKSLSVFWAPLVLFIGARWIWDHATLIKEYNEQAYIAATALAKSAQFVVFMFIGVAFHYFYVRRIAAELFLAIAVLLFGACALDWQSAQFVPSTSDLWSYGFAVAVFALAMHFKSMIKPTAATKFLADISYPLYVSHMIAGYVVLRALLDKGVPSTVAALITLAGAILVAWLLHKVVEAPTHKLAKRVARWSQAPTARPVSSQPNVRFSPSLR